MTPLLPLPGILCILGAAFLLSRNRRAICWRIIAWGLGLRLVLVIFALHTRLGCSLVTAISDALGSLPNISCAGSSKVFGPPRPGGGP